MESITNSAILWQLFRLILPLAIIFLLIIPLLMVFFVYITVSYLLIYRWTKHRKEDQSPDDYWNDARSTMSAFWNTIGRIWHGYDVKGLENIPERGPCLIIFYHGATPLDIYYMTAKIILHQRRMPRFVGDKSTWDVPGLSILCEAFCVTPGSLDECIKTLEQGNILCISPGGVREAIFADTDVYEPVWENRVGFAKIAYITKAPIVTMFTQNVRESYRVPKFFTGARGRRLYERTRSPFAPLYGGLPVKMRSWLSKPIRFDFNNFDEEYEIESVELPSNGFKGRPISAEDRLLTKRAIRIRDVVRTNMQTLIKDHQRLPGSIPHALLDRVIL